MADQSHSPLCDALRGIVGAEHLREDLGERTFFSTDIAGTGEIATAVVAPADSAQLAAVVKVCAEQGFAVVPRGGGFSYTSGYTPAEAHSVMIDMRRMYRILEINPTDMYVRVEAGCTWRALYEALKAQGLRTPYFGPMSGFNATVGGALSQGSFFLGSTQHGTTADSVLSLEIVLADGAIVHTGSDSDHGTPPFFRNYGPDLTGLFLGDTGALGFKTVATLKLIQFPSHQAYGSFAIDSGEATVAVLSEIGRAGLAAEAYAWDPYFVEIMSEASTGTRQDLAMLWGVVRNAAGVIDGIGAATRIALQGKRVFRKNTHIVQVTIDDVSAAGAAERLRQVRHIARRHGAAELAPTVPRALRGTPFVDFNVPERRTPLRNLPTNSIYAHSRAPGALAALRKLLAGHAETLDRHGMKIGMVLFAVGRNAMCIEPLVYWDDPRHFQHNRLTETSDLEGLSRHALPPEATAFAFTLREHMKTVMHANGAVHVQIGKSYPYLATREPRLATLLRAIKHDLDPARRINPASLGL